MKETTIGILAGMGARSTAPFVDMVVDQCQALYGATYDDEYPHMIVYALPTPMYLDRPLDHPRVCQVICNGLKRLEGCGVDFIAMPCNTAHQYFDQLGACIGIPLLNIVDETINAFETPPKSVALLATQFTMDAGIYHRGFETIGATLIQEESWQDQVNDLLNGIKSNDDLDTLKTQWRSLLGQIQAEGIEVAVLGCTDLNAVSQYVEPPLSMVDATEMLAKATVTTYLDLSRVPT